ncbi:MAG: 30S ribosomal protein S2 [Candidatus Cloacimonadaceae bacterium]
MSVVSMKQLLEAGVHFGHQTFKWNPKMKKYIFIKRNGIHIIDLKQTVDAINEAYQFLKEVAARSEYILFVGTKKQAQSGIKEAAEKAGVFYVNNRWYGGMLTNMQTIRQSIEKMKYYEEIVADGTISSYTKLEQLRMKHKHDKIESALGGIRDMDALPGAVFIVDTDHEAISVHEARVLKIPVIGMVDTNSDPDLVDYVIPSNDDATRAVALISDIMANAVIEGKGISTEGADVAKAAAVDDEADKNIDLEAELAAAPIDASIIEEKEHISAEHAVAEPEAKEEVKAEVKEPETEAAPKKPRAKKPKAEEEAEVN